MRKIVRIRSAKSTVRLTERDVQGYLAHKKTPPSLGPPQDPRHRPTVGSYGGAFSYERGTPVAPTEPFDKWSTCPTAACVGGRPFHTVDHAGLVPLDSEGNVTKFAPREALKLIVLFKLTFHERVVAHRVVRQSYLTECIYQLV